MKERKNSFFRDFGWKLGYPFVFLHLATKFFFAKKKLKKYIKNPSDFLDEEKYGTIYKICKPIGYLLRVKTAELFKEKKISKKPQLIICNHRSIVDALIIFKFLYETLGTNFIFIAKKELADHKYGKLLKLIDTIFIDRSNLREINDIIEKQKNVIVKDHKSVVIFPEGTRNPTDELLDFKPSALEVAYKTMCIIQPILLYNTEFFLESKDKRTNQEIELEILKNIQPSSFLSCDRQILSKNIQKDMQNELNKLIKINTNNQVNENDKK